MKQNYQLLLDQCIASECQGEKRPSLLLHACCAPCSSYVLEYLSHYFAITLFFYNPNISPEEEHRFRQTELERLIQEMGFHRQIPIITPPYDPSVFQSMAKGLENEAEGGKRCQHCYRIRLHQSAIFAARNNFDFFTTTLSISPYKNAEWLNTIGSEEGEKAGVRYLLSDFKKRNGYRRSCELSKLYGLYRQNYCGCIYSRQVAQKKQS